MVIVEIISFVSFLFLWTISFERQKMVDSRAERIFKHAAGQFPCIVAKSIFRFYYLQMTEHLPVLLTLHSAILLFKASAAMLQQQFTIHESEYMKIHTFELRKKE